MQHDSWRSFNPNEDFAKENVKVVDYIIEFLIKSLIDVQSLNGWIGEVFCKIINIKVD
jgi:hypothetical protein